MFVVEYTNQAFKSLKKIPLKWQKRIVKAIGGLADDPYRGKKLQGELQGLFSLRVWPYRIVYFVKKQKLIVMVLDIGHGQGIYKK